MISYKEVDAALRKLEASEDTELRYREGKKHRQVHYYYRGKHAGKLGFSKSPSDAKSSDYSNQAKQMHLEPRQFKSLADCTMDVDDYEKLIRGKRVV